MPAHHGGLSIIKGAAVLDAERLRQLLHYDPATGIFTWKVRRRGVIVGSAAGSPKHKPGDYILICIDGVRYRAHRLAWLYVRGEWPAGDLDHKDLVRDHNAIDNLRPATTSQNAANRGMRGAAGFKGARYRRHSGRWSAQITKDGKQLYLGSFPTAEAAHAAYCTAAERLFGEYARAA